MAQSEPRTAHNVLVRRATVGDLWDMMAIEHQCFTAPWHVEAMRMDLAGPSDEKIYLALEVDGTLAGYIGAHYYVGEAHITTLAVTPRYRRMGLGELLVLVLLQAVIELQGTYATLEHRVSNRAAQQLYRKVGFVPVRIRKGYYQDNGEDAVVVEMDDLQNPQRRLAIKQLHRDWQRRYRYDVQLSI